MALSMKMALVPGGHGEEVDYGTEPEPHRFIFVICVAGFYHVYQHNRWSQPSDSWIGFYEIPKRVFYLSVE